MSLAAIVAMMLTLAPLAPPARLARHAEAIASATSDERETVALVVIDFAETSFRDVGRNGGRVVPFGALAMPGVDRATLGQVAVWVVECFHRAQRQPRCGWWRRVFSFYVTGRCGDGAEGARRGRMMRRLVRMQ